MICCLWCGQELRFDPTRGSWVHAATGQREATRRDDAERSHTSNPLYTARPDDHCATPSYS